MAPLLFPLGDCDARAPHRVGRLTRSFATVQQTPTGSQKLLVKQLLPELAADRTLAERWFAQARANTGLSHPACVRAVACGTGDGHAYLAVEEVAGQCLRALQPAWSDRPARLAREAALHVARGTLAALVHAQERASPLVHLDLDPWSILIRWDGSIVVSEFGLWAALPADDAARRRFDGGRVHHCAPELARAQPGDARSDLFSLGSVLLELITGKPLFPAASPLEVTLAIASGVREPVRTLAPDLPASLSEFLETLLAVDPAERFPSARAALHALHAIAPARARFGTQRMLASLVGVKRPSTEDSLHPRARRSVRPRDRNARTEHDHRVSPRMRHSFAILVWAALMGLGFLLGRLLR